MRIGEQRRGLFGQRKSKDRVKTGRELFCRRIRFGFSEDVVEKGTKIDNKQDIGDQYGKLVARMIGEDGSEKEQEKGVDAYGSFSDFQFTKSLVGNGAGIEEIFIDIDEGNQQKACEQGADDQQSQCFEFYKGESCKDEVSRINSQIEDAKEEKFCLYRMENILIIGCVFAQVAYNGRLSFAMHRGLTEILRIQIFEAEDAESVVILGAHGKESDDAKDCDSDPV